LEAALPRLNYSGLLSPKPKSQSTQHKHDHSEAVDPQRRNQDETAHTGSNDQETNTKKEHTVASLIQTHPWAALGLGFVLGGLVGRTIKRSHRAFKLTQHQS
jgi:ElaB/YqjD/DUF883 family membrane-anchored ribosome-binding protein